jgi:hypothetical protein
MQGRVSSCVVFMKGCLCMLFARVLQHISPAHGRSCVDAMA